MLENSFACYFGLIYFEGIYHNSVVQVRQETCLWSLTAVSEVILQLTSGPMFWIT